VLPIITNTLAIAINQRWAGHPGLLLKSFLPAGAAATSADGFLQLAGALGAGNEYGSVKTMTLIQARQWCCRSSL